MQALSFDELSFFDQLRLPPFQFLTDRFDRALERAARHHIMRLGIDGHARRVFLNNLTEQRIDCGNRIDFVTPQLHAISFILITGIDLDHITAHAKAAPLEIDVRALVLQLDQTLKQSIARNTLAGFEKDKHAVVGIRVAETVDT